MTANAPNTLQSVLVFDGKKDWVVLNHPLKEITDAITIEFWANGSSNLNVSTSIIEAYGGAKNTRILNIHFPWGNKYIYWDAGNANGYDRINKIVKAREYKDTWNHWAFTKDTKTGVMSIYRNGEVWHRVQGKKKTLAGIKSFVIGSGVPKRHYWAGALAEFRIWTVGLEQNQIQANMHQRLTGEERGLLVYLPLNEGKGALVKDQSKTGKKNNGEITGASWQEREIPIQAAPTKTTTSKSSKIESTQAKAMNTEKEGKTTKAANEAEINYVPATGLEDYARWKTMYKDYKRDKDEKPFRRGRIWA